MQNFQATNEGFKYEQIVSEDGNKRVVVRLEVHYLAGSQHKGVSTFLRTITQERNISTIDNSAYTSEEWRLFAAVSKWALIQPRKNTKQVAIVAEQLDSSAPMIAAAYRESRDLGEAALAQAIAEKVAQS